ncbi:MAG: hypothetical protein GSR73_04745 [Desulfurococcales archaeon]|nr:hypothetical protein [Desulfurococcales archaeon]
MPEGADYIQCLVCGRVTPTDKGVCYHCHSPLPQRIYLPEGTVVCPNCLKVTPVDTGYCRHCRAPLPGYARGPVEPGAPNSISTGLHAAGPGEGRVVAAAGVADVIASLFSRRAAGAWPSRLPRRRVLRVGALSRGRIG